MLKFFKTRNVNQGRPSYSTYDYHQEINKALRRIDLQNRKLSDDIEGVSKILRALGCDVKELKNADKTKAGDYSQDSVGTITSVYERIIEVQAENVRWLRNQLSPNHPAPLSPEAMRLGLDQLYAGNPMSSEDSVIPLDEMQEDVGYQSDAGMLDRLGVSSILKASGLKNTTIE